MKMYRINNQTVRAELDDGSKYEIPWDISQAVDITSDTLEKFVMMAGHLVFDKE